MLDSPHMAPLTSYVQRLRSRRDVRVPDFDPMDGGVDARILFLFEKPGPKTDREHGGSGFISRNNDDLTAAATHDFMKQAEIPRKETIIWNFVPWWNDTRKLKRQELADGRNQIRRFFRCCRT